MLAGGDFGKVEKTVLALESRFWEYKLSSSSAWCLSEEGEEPPR